MPKSNSAVKYEYFMTPTYFTYDRENPRSELQQMIDELFFTRCEIRDYELCGRDNPAEYSLYKGREAYLDQTLRGAYGVIIPFD